MSDRLLFSCLKNEGPFLIEWLAYHRALGFGTIMVFSNNCDDGSDELLDALDAAGALLHIRNDAIHDRGPQWAALNSATLRKALRKADWAMHLDIDEFVVVKSGGGLDHLITAIDGSDAVSIPWRFFGNCGVDAFTDRPVVQQFTRASNYPIMFPRQALMYKTLFRPQSFKKPGIHAPKPDGPVIWRNGDGRRMSDSFDPNRSVMFGPDFGDGLAQINHYALRSRESFLVKSDRGLPNRRNVEIDLNYWIMRNFHDVADHHIAPAEPAAERERQRLLSLPGITELHDACCQMHREKATAILQTQAGADLYAAISVAGPTRTPNRTEVSRIYKALNAVYGGSS